MAAGEKQMRNSKYWDDFNFRADETVSCLINARQVPVRRVAVFITEKCNMNCAYCNHAHDKKEMSKACFDSIVKEFGKDAIIHITGGEPSTVKWLYPYLEKNGAKYRFHLNTNAYLMPPSKSIKRLKVSLDSFDEAYWNALVGRNAFRSVVDNIKACLNNTVVSVTYTMTKDNYRSIPEFIQFAKKELSGIYAIFFSVYKGDNPRFAFSEDDIETFFEYIKPCMDSSLDEESKALLNETIQEKFRIMQGVRFPENESDCCFLSLSERVFSPSGEISACSHLYRDGIKNKPGIKNVKCKYGCNRRLVAFNEIIKDRTSCAKSAQQNIKEQAGTSHNTAMPGGVPPQICEAQTSA